MKRIEKLTPEQEARLPVFRQKYLDIACGGARADRDRLQSALNDVYAEIGKEPPALFVFDSPAACMLAIKIFEIDKAGKFALGYQLWVQLGGQLWDQLRYQLRDRLRRQLWGQLRGQLGGQLGSQLRGQLGGQLGSQLRGQLGGQLGGQLQDQLGDQLRSQLWDQLGDQKIWNGSFLWGSQDIYWIAWAKFAEEIGVKLTKQQSRRLDIMDRIGRECEWWWPFENIVIASQRPLAVKWDDSRRLHCENGPAIAYADGYSLHAWHGTRLPAKWIEERDTIDPAEILAERDVEKRAAGLACIGMARALQRLEHRVIDSDPDPLKGEVIEVRIPDLPRPARYLKAHCPRNGTIMEGLPPEINTVLAAQAWRVGLDPSQFQYPALRT